MLKDLKLAMEAAQSVDADVPMGHRAAELYQAFADAGSGGLDFSAIIKTLEGSKEARFDVTPSDRAAGRGPNGHTQPAGAAKSHFRPGNGRSVACRNAGCGCRHWRSGCHPDWRWVCLFLRWRPQADEGRIGLARAIAGANPSQLQYWNQRLPLAFQALEVPVIAAVNGPAIGAGLDLATMCDIRIAGESAKFAESFVKVGIVPGDGGAWLLPRIGYSGRRNWH